jgi:hypothetical protein
MDHVAVGRCFMLQGADYQEGIHGSPYMKQCKGRHLRALLITVFWQTQDFWLWWRDAKSPEYLCVQATSLPRERVKDFQTEAQRYVPQVWDRQGARAAVESIGSGVGKMSVVEGNGYPRPPTAEMARQQNLLRSNSFQ